MGPGYSIGIESIRGDLLWRAASFIRELGRGKPLPYCLSMARRGWAFGPASWRRFSGRLLSMARLHRRKGMPLYGAFRDAPESTVMPMARDLFDGLWARRSGEESGRILSSGVFYLCSSHANPAGDHARLEGRMYVSKHWRKRTPKSLLKQVESYIAEHGCAYADEIVGPPHYLCTRPNCRHYLREIPIEDALSKTEEELLRANGMMMKSVPSVSYAEQMRRKYAELARGARVIGDAAGSPEEAKADAMRYGALERKWAFQAKAKTRA